MAHYWLDKLYARSPIWLQNVFVSAKGLEYRLRRGDDSILQKHFDFLLRSERWPLDRYRSYQFQQLRRTLHTAFRYVPYYRDLRRELGCEVEDFKRLEDIRLLPLLDKSQVRGQEHRFLNESINLKKCSKGFTSGTTGTPINLYETRESFSKRWAFVARLRRWAGLNDPFYPRRAQFTGRNIIPTNQDPNTPVYWRSNRPGNALLFSTTHISPDTVPYYADALCKFEPELIDGYPSAMLAIARVSHRLNLELPSPIAIIVSAETLLPEHRRELEEAFRCKVYDQYAASEPSCFWCDCEYGAMHINPEYGVSEIIKANGEHASEGEEGEVVVTSFLNPAMMLIRYRLGDMAARGREYKCGCGRAMPRIERVIGRVDDILFVPDRGYVGRLDPVFKGLNNIIETQIVQEDLTSIRVLVVPDSGYDVDTEQRLIKNLRAKLGHRVVIEIGQVDQVPRGPNGKFRSVISKVKHLYPDRMQ